MALLLVALAFHSEAKLIYPMAAAPESFLDTRTYGFRIHSWSKDKWLSRNLSGFGHQAGTAEEPSLVEWESTGLFTSPGWDSHCGTTPTAEASSLRYGGTIRSSALRYETTVILFNVSLTNYLNICVHPIGSFSSREPQIITNCGPGCGSRETKV